MTDGADGGKPTHLSPEKVTELLLITQYFDTLVHVSNGKASTIFLPHAPGSTKDISEQIRSGVLEGSAGAMPLLGAPPSSSV